MSRLPNFTASLLHHIAYGLDIGGEVHDFEPQNAKDLRYRNSPDGGFNGGSPNPQQYTQGPEAQTLPPDAPLYHGTTLNDWNEGGATKLRVSTNIEEAKADAKTAAEGENAPIVVMIKFGDLGEYELKPDSTHSEVHEGVSWQECLKDTGVFCIVGDIDSLKPNFKLVNG
jgi:hypothetical protein